MSPPPRAVPGRTPPRTLRGPPPRGGLTHNIPGTRPDAITRTHGTDAVISFPSAGGPASGRGMGSARMRGATHASSEGVRAMVDVEGTIEALLSERRVFEPPEGFRARALVSDRSIYERAERDLEGFWAEQAEHLRWSRPWDRVLEWNPPWVKWFLGGELNVADNCLDRHVEAGGGDKVAYHWVGEPEADGETITYAELLERVVKLANALKAMGVRKGTPVGIYMGMVPGLPVAMLACARLGAPHTVVFGGFSAQALADRLNDMEC